MKVEYSHTNSGGSWWLKDEHWHALAEAGWTVEWFKDQEHHRKYYGDDPRFLGALAGTASKDFDSPAEAVREFERITGQDASEEGCNCCGAPHSFSWSEGSDNWGYASGADIVALLYGDSAPKNLREAVERLQGDDDA